MENENFRTLGGNGVVKIGGQGWCLIANYAYLPKSDYVQIKNISIKKH